MKIYHMRLCSLAAALLLSACGGGSDGPPPVSTIEPPPTTEPPPVAEATRIPPEVFTKLEEEGAIPVLDRSDTLRGNNFNDDLGIRVDVKTYIDEHFSQTVPQQKAAWQFASAIQAQIEVDLEDDDAVQDVMQRVVNSIVCLGSHFDANSIRTVTSDIQAISANTYARMSSYLTFSEAVDGEVISLPDTEEEVCDA